ncbi:MAG: hypothetical protein A2138_21970 [Deltaproteobacteria bacterium RBG_16_71_12]|nr:MAG: hypothetical protein A2138_21970 [Deltaproteobacteria bacterium RBG_16_71_12]
MSGIWGIDLGTTNSVIAQLVDGRPVPVAVGGSAIVPSVVLFDEDGRAVAGREARNLELLHPERAVHSAKRKIGTDHRYPVALAAGLREVTPEEVSAEILRALKNGAEQHGGLAVNDVVITVPAYFDDAQRRATLQAGALAGLNVLRLLNEPTSAALVYEQAGLAGDRPRTILVYDLGGGTFDVSVLEVFEGIREVKAVAGNTHLGGDDFDDMLVRVFLDHLRTHHGVDVREDARAMARLRRLAEESKIKLSQDTALRVREEFIATSSGAPVHLDVELTRRQLEALIEPLLASTIELTQRAVKDAGIGPEDIDAICLVGGSTRIPAVRDRLAAAFAAEVHEEIDPDLAVGLGAAVQAGLLQGVAVERILVDVAGHTLGIRAFGELDSGYAEEPDTFAPVLRRNTALPAERAEEFYTHVDGQARIEVTVFQGEAARCSENTRVGSFFFALEPAPAGCPVRVTFAYDLNGIIRVHVSQVGTDNAKSVALSVADAGTRAQEQQPALAERGPPTAIERRARKLLDDPAFEHKADLAVLLDAFLATHGAGRVEAEEHLLDFFFEVEADS